MVTGQGRRGKKGTREDPRKDMRISTKTSQGGGGFVDNNAPKKKKNFLDCLKGNPTGKKKLSGEKGKGKIYRKGHTGWSNRWW